MEGSSLFSGGDVEGVVGDAGGEEGTYDDGGGGGDGGGGSGGGGGGDDAGTDGADPMQVSIMHAPVAMSITAMSASSPLRRRALKPNPL